MYTTLLVPLDGSPQAEQALAPAVEIARATGAAIELLMVRERVPAAGARPVTAEGRHGGDGSPEERLQYLQHLADHLHERFGAVAGWAFVDGSPGVSIAHHAKAARAGLIVMASRGLTGVRREINGSIADEVVRRARVPVLMLRRRDEPAPHVISQGVGGFRRILVLLDGSAIAERIVDAVVPLAKCGSPKVTLLRVVAPVLPQTISALLLDEVLSLVPDTDATRHAQREAQADLDRVATRLRCAGIASVETAAMISSHPAKAVLEFITAHETDLVAMTTRGRGATRLVVGSVADEILRETASALLVYRPPTARPARRWGLRHASQLDPMEALGYDDIPMH